MKNLTHYIPGLKTRSISKEITISLVLLLIVVEGILMFVIYRNQSRFLTREFERKAQSYAASLGEVLGVPIWEYNIEQISRIGAGYIQNELVHGLKISDTRGDVLFHQQKPNPIKQEIRTIPVRYRERLIGNAELVLSMDKYNDDLRRLRNSIVLILLVSLAAILAATGFLLKIFINKPLSILKNGIDRIAIGDYSENFQEIQHTEMAEIAKRFQEMVTKIKNREAMLRKEVEVREQAQEKLKKSETRYRILFESASDAILIMQADQFVNCNQKALELFRCSREEMIGQSPYEFSPKRQPDQIDSREKTLAKINLCLNGAPQLFEWTHKRADGTTFDAEVSLTAMELEQSVYIQAIVRDISERKQAQELLVQTEKMMSVGGLAAGMAHEINNPLAGILQNAQVIINRLDKNLRKNHDVAEACHTDMDTIEAYVRDRGIRTMLGSIVDSGMRAAKIVENMLSFSRKSDARFEQTDLGELLDKTIEIAATDYDLKKKYDFRQIRIVREYAPGTPRIMCHQSQIQQVLLNILTNGAQSMAEEKARTQRPSIFTLRLRYDERWVYIEIEDNGSGMSEEQQKRIFEPFFTTKNTQEGTGLGLSVSYFIITESHKGTLSAESTQGKGTTFTIRLPQAGEQPQEG